jgi:hypothetical protein
VPRLRLRIPAAPRGAGPWLAVWLVLGCAPAHAQVTVFTDPLAPQLQTDPRRPPRFQQGQRPMLTQLAPPLGFAPPASGAGDAGFDSTNSRKKMRAKTRRPAQSQTGGQIGGQAGSQVGAPANGLSTGPANDTANGPVNAQAIAPGLPAPVPLSPYQRPPPTATDASNTANGAYAQAPGTPPVELGPIRAAKKRKAHAEPEDAYAPLGVHAGAFTLFPAIEFIGGYDTNPAQSPGGSGARLYSVAPELLVQSNWSRHEFKAELRGSYTGYSPDETPALSRPYFNGKADGRIDITKNTRIDLGTRALVSTDNPGSPNLPAGLAKLPVFITYGGSAGLGQRFNRLDLSLKGDAERTVYQDSTLTDGTTSSNADRQYNQYGAKLRGSYELSPGVSPFVEVGADTRVHDLATDSSGYQRDSKGVTGLLGSSFELAHQLTGEIGAGYTRRSYADPRFDNLIGLVGDASLLWTATALTTAKLSATSSVGESTVPGVSGILYRNLNLQVDHALRQWLIGTVKLGFGLNDYVGMDREDKLFAAGVGLTYKLNRSMQLKGEVQQNWLRSNDAGNNYSNTVFLFGLRLQE